MAVIKAKPEKVVAFFLAMMERELVTPFLATRIPQVNFEGAKNDTVTLRIGGLRAVARDYEWRTRTAPIVLDDIAGEDGIDVKLDTHVYSATALTDEQMTLDEINFARDVLGPQVEAVVGRLESKVVTAFDAINFKSELPITADDDPLLVGVEARRLLDSHKVAPRNGRYFLIGSDVEAAWLASDRLARYDSTGQEGSPALRDAIIGKLAGAPVISSLSLRADFAFYGHRSALVLANVAPKVPTGATAGRTGISKNGFATRWIQDYDPNYARDRSLVSSFAGTTSVNDERQMTGPNAGDLLPEGDANRGLYNVRGVKLTFTGGGSVMPPEV